MEKFIRDHIYLVSDVKKLPEPSQMAEVEVVIKGVLPQDYKDFMKSFGGGEFNSYLYLISPEDILETRDEWKDTLESDFWTEDSCLPMELRNEVYVLAYTIDSDLFVFHPQKKEIYCLPSQDDTIYLAGETLFEAISWAFESEKLIEASTNMFFRPLGESSHLRYRNSTPPDLSAFAGILKVLGEADYAIEKDEFMDVFFRCWGAHINYSQEYNQLIITYDAKYAREYYIRIDKLFSEQGFYLTEKENISDN